MMTVDLARCVRCAACAVVAPALFAISRRGMRVIRQPHTTAELAAATTAALICPVQALTEAR